jgi:hypothetical protein
VPDCSGPYEVHIIDFGVIKATSAARSNVSGEFACSGSASGSRQVAFDVNANISGSYDPDTANNEAQRTVTIAVLGTSMLPSPSPEPPPIQEPGPPTAPTPGLATSPSGQPVAGGSIASGSLTAPAASVQTPAAAVLGAAALPQTGEQGGEGGPNWLLVGAAGVGLGLSAGAGLVVRRIIARRG